MTPAAASLCRSNADLRPVRSPEGPRYSHPSGSSASCSRRASSCRGGSPASFPTDGPDPACGPTDRPGAASLAVAYVAAFVGVFATPLPSGSEAAVGFLAVLVGLTAYYGGVLSERERLRAGGGSEAPARAVSEND